MPKISVTTVINAPIERVFDLARSIDAHPNTAEATGERVVAGRASGLIELGEEVTWEGKHLGLTRRLSVRVTALERPKHFQDVMVKGDFLSMTHDHFFEPSLEGTVMRDELEFTTPFGILGRIVNSLVLERHMRNFLLERNAVLRRIAESSEWEGYLN